MNKNYLFKSIQAGNCYRRKELIRCVNLESYLNKNHSYTELQNLALAINYAIRHPVAQRNSPGWKIYRRATKKTDQQLSQIALLTANKLSNFDCFMAVNFINYQTITVNYPQFWQLLYRELNR